MNAQPHGTLVHPRGWRPGESGVPCSLTLRLLKVLLGLPSPFVSGVSTLLLKALGGDLIRSPLISLSKSACMVFRGLALSSQRGEGGLVS